MGSILLSPRVLSGIVGTAASIWACLVTAGCGEEERKPLLTRPQPTCEPPPGKRHTTEFTLGLEATLGLACSPNGMLEIFGCGWNRVGLFGSGVKKPTPHLSPVPLSGNFPKDPVVQTVVGIQHACFLLASGGVYCAGRGGLGQLGNNSTEDSSEPVPVVSCETGQELQDVVRLAAGNDYNLALLPNGTFRAWGSNGNFELGIGVDPGASFCAVAIPEVPQVGDPSLFDAAWRNSVAVTLDGEVWTWGEGGLGEVQLYPRQLPTEFGRVGAVQVATSGLHIGIVYEDGRAMLLGRNDSGELCNGTTESSSLPVEVAGIDGPIDQIALGDGFTLLRSAEKVWGCGKNDRGQLGRLPDENPHPLPELIEGLTGVTGIFARFDSVCAKLAQGCGVCWGANYFGNLCLGYIGFEGAPERAVPSPQPVECNW